MKNNRKSQSIHWLAVVAVVFVMFSAFIINRHKSKLTEAMHLPYHEVNLEEVEDGVYTGKTYTSFLHLQLEVTVKNHKLEKIEVIENQGEDGETARPIIQRMLEENKIVVPAIKGAEMGSLVYISCVSMALTGSGAEDAGSDSL